MTRNPHLTPDELSSSMIRARQLRSETIGEMVKVASQRLTRAVTHPAAEYRVLAKCAIAPLTAGHRHNRSSVNPLMVRGLAIS